MQVDVEHGLSRSRIAVEHCPVTGTVVALFFGNVRGGAHHGADQPVVRRRQVVERRDVLLRDHQDVHRRLRVDVVEGEQLIVFVDLRRGNVTRNDLAEQAAHTSAIFRSMIATRGMRCKSWLMLFSVSAGNCLIRPSSAAEWRWPISMNSVPPGFRRAALTSRICTMSRIPSSPAFSAIAGSYSRTSGDSSSYSLSLTYGGFDRMKSNGPVVPDR